MKRDAVTSVTIVVFCQDSRFLNDHFRFIEGDLGFKSGGYIIVPVLGGASVLARPERFETEFNSVLNQMLFYLSMHKPDSYRIILVNHEDCLRAGLSKDEGKKDLQEAAINLNVHLHSQYNGKVELWYAHLRNPKEPLDGLRFEALPAPKREFAGIAGE